MSREYPCVYFDSGKCRKFEVPGYVDYCVLGPCSHETPSNADRIRAMSDEELAKFLDDSNSMGCVCPTKDCEATCIKCIVSWLQQPVEEVDHE